MGGTQSTREEAVSVHLLSLSRGYENGASQVEASSTGCSSERKETIKFNSKNTHMIAFGMDANELSGAKEDATLISDTFVDVGVVPKDNKHCYIESQDENDDCTLEGMKRHLRGVCEKAVDNGLVIFFYAGHLHSSSDGKCALVQKGFQKEKEETWLTAEVFSGWLSECSGLTFAGVLCILDCCQAATMGRLSVSGQTNTYILAATSKLEFSWEVPSTKQKKNSIFSLSLKYYGINANEFKDCQGLLQLTNIYERCKECSSKLSSLHLNRPQTPVLSVARPRGTTNKPYIDWLKKAEDGPLKWLNEKGLLSCPDILMVAVYCMAYSIKNIDQTEMDDFGVVFNHIAQSIKQVTTRIDFPGIELDDEHKEVCKSLYEPVCSVH